MQYQFKDLLYFQSPPKWTIKEYKTCAMWKGENEIITYSYDQYQ
jgi:ribosome biogenesis SPOUT family RNA methylase Rps3